MPPLAVLVMLASIAQSPPAGAAPRQPAFTPHARPLGHHGVPGSGNRGGRGAPPNAAHHRPPERSGRPERTGRAVNGQ